MSARKPAPRKTTLAPVGAPKRASAAAAAAKTRELALAHGRQLALVRTGDRITVDVPARRLHLEVSDAELAARRAAWVPPPPRYARGYGWLAAQPVSSSDLAGASSMAVVRKMVLRPPAMRIRKLAGMRMVAPEMPAMAVSVNSSAWVNGNPRLSICTVMMPHMPQTAKPHNSAGMEIQRLR